MLGKKREALIKSFTTAANSGKQKRMSTLFVRICQTNQFLTSLEQIANSKPQLTSGKGQLKINFTDSVQWCSSISVGWCCV